MPSHNPEISPEQLRILRACRDGRLKLRHDPSWRWYIEGDDQLPISCERKRLLNRSLMQNVWDRAGDTYVVLLTDRGHRALAEAA